MAIIVFQHAPTDHPGRLGLTFRDHGRPLDVRRLDLPVGGPTRNRHIPTDFDDVDGVISLGGPMNVTDAAQHPWMAAEMEFLKAAHERKLPVLGVCLGAQLIAKALGGEVGPTDKPEWGMGRVKQLPVANTDIVLAGVAWNAWQFHAHGQEVKTLPPGAVGLQFSDRCKVQSFRAGLRTYGFQYHFECDLADIQDFLACGDPQIVQSGIDPKSELDAAKAHYDEYARLGDRLCGNLALYLFSVSRKIVA